MNAAVAVEKVTPTETPAISARERYDRVTGEVRNAECRLNELRSEQLQLESDLGTLHARRQDAIRRADHAAIDATESEIRRGERQSERQKMLIAEAESEVQSLSAKAGVLAAAVGQEMAAIDRLDQWTAGFRPGELVIITAETGSGKTLLAQQTRGRACRDGYKSLFCSGEMWARHLLRRELAAAAHVEPIKMRRDDLLTSEDMQALIEAAAHQCRKCRILDGELEITRIRRVARGLKARTGLDLLILDYDELIEAPGRDENEQLRRLVRMAKSIGMELNCAVILISQLRKEYGQSEKSDTRPPSLSRLYGSGAKIKHAGIVIYADRKWEETLEGVQKEAVLWVLKNRDGRTGPIPARFDIRSLRFEQAEEPSQALAWRDHTDPRGKGE